ncbi:MAG: M20/M25/M40 family metallo-hydrolase [Promethearchaeota archaeon]
MNSVKSNENFEGIIRATNNEFLENELYPFLKIPSNTFNRKGILKAKEYLISYISSFCEDITEYQGQINPLILAKVKGKIKDSLLIYMMYDTQPVNKEKEWISEPFGAEIQKLPPPLDVLGNCIIARGAYNSKTPLLCFLNIIKLLKVHDELPLSLLILLDGEEETGSPTLLEFIKTNKEQFKGCLDTYYPSTKQDLNGFSVLKLGYKGILSITIKISTKNKEPHSSFSGMIPNPASELIALLNVIHSNNKFQIDCLKEPYKLTSEEISIIESLIENLDIEKIKKKAGIVQTIKSDSNQVFIDYLFNPTYNISTLKSGYLEEGTKNMVANEALCNIDIRFAHNISVDEIFQQIQEKVKNFAKYSKCKIELIKNIGYEGSRVNRDSVLVSSLITSFKDVPTEIWPISAAAAPLSMINRELGLNFITGGLGIGGFAHSPNEFIQKNSIINTRLSNYYFLKTYSELYSKNQLKGFE